MNKKVYPYSKTLSTTLQSADAALIAMRLVRELEFMLDISATEVEILLGVSALRNPSSLRDIYNSVKHVSQTRVKRLLKNMIEKKCLVANPRIDAEGLFYSLAPNIADGIKYVDRNKLTA